MEQNNNMTVFQRLTRAFGYPGKTKPGESPFYKFSKDEILKTTDREEYEKELLQAQQSQYLSDTWKKLDQSLYNQSVYYEPNRLSAYYDYESMEFTPEISAALDIYAEESTTLSEKGDILTIYSESERVKNVLKDLFINKLDINTNLQMWARGVCKYGDNFVYLKVSPEKGIIGCQQLPNVEIERIEGAASKTPTQNVNVENMSGNKELKFQWKNRELEFQSWEIGHFRLLGDDRKLPYGTCCKSDSYIKTENGTKQIKDIKKGDLVYSFDTDTQRNELSKVLDTVNSGKKICYKLSTKHNYIDVSEEHKIMYYDIITNSFKYKNTLEFNVGDLLVINKKWDDGINIPIDKTLPIDYEKSQKYSKKNRYWNDVNKYIPDYIDENFAELFGFLIGDGGIDKNTIWFAMGKDDFINQKFITYLQEFTGKDGKRERNDTIFRVHSKMLVTILKRMGFDGLSKTKRLPHWVFECKNNIKNKVINGLFLADGSFFIDNWNVGRYSLELANENLIKDVKVILQNLGYKTGKINSRIRENVYIKGKKIKKPSKSYRFYYYLTDLKQEKKYDIFNRKNNDFIIEPITTIETIGVHETHDIYVENENHNFYANGIVVHNSMIDKVRRIWKQLLLAEDAMLIYRTSRAPERRVFKVFVGNMEDKDIEPYVQKIANKFKRDVVVDSRNGQTDTRYNQMAVDQDFFIPVRDPNLNMPIETLPGAQNLGEIADIEYIQKKLLAALRIPKAFLGFEEVVGEGKTLALMDIRFARTINKIQKSLIQELNKIALIHLYLLGLEDELENFTLSLTNPSAQSDLLRIEQWKEKISLYKDATSDQSQIGILPVSHTWGKKNILGMSESEVLLDLQQQRMERALGFELMNTQSIIKRTGVFDDVDKKYGIPEEERETLEKAGGTEGAEGAEGGDMGDGGLPPLGNEMGGGPPLPGGDGGEEPLSEMFSNHNLNKLFDYDKAKRNIYEIETKINKILNE
jgi:intein/homing endonuclease